MEGHLQEALVDESSISSEPVRLNVGRGNKMKSILRRAKGKTQMTDRRPVMGNLSGGATRRAQEKVC